MLSSFNFDVEAEIAHFRDPTTHAFLNTFLAPPPHTIIGFLGNCYGSTEIETEEIAHKVKVGCTVLDLKGFLKDLVIFVNQKKIKGKSFGTFPRTRKYLVRPKYRFYAASKDSTLISDLRKSVSAPRRMPFLGISDCLASIQNISDISQANPIQLKDTESVVCIEDDQDIEYHTKIKEPNKVTVYTEKVRSPRNFEITQRGRIPKNHKKFLMSVNCRLFFKRPLEGYEINGENVCLV
jgi:CRISPR-associated protein Cas5 subtype I-B